MNKLLTPDFVTALLEQVNAQLNRNDSAAEVAMLQSRIQGLNLGITNLIHLAEKVGPTEEVLLQLRQRQEEKDRLQQQLQLLQVSQEEIYVPRDTFEDLLDEMREPLASDTLPAQQAALQRVVDRIVVERNRAELYYQFLCANLYKVPPARFVIKGSTFQPLVVAF
jgi:hypothetical protein